MLKEVTKTGKSIEEAVETACRELGTTQEKCDIEVLQQPKKSLFGILKTEAKVKVTLKETVRVSVSAEGDNEATLVVDEKPNNKEEKVKAAVEYLEKIIIAMGLENVSVKVDMQEDSAMLTLEGDNLGVLIGRRGETLDSMQYLTSLVCNRVEGKYFRITLNCGNYRKKREDALKDLARKISAKVKRTGRSQMLEPMNPYERRIIHSEIATIDGVVSKSKGDEPNRRVIIFSTSRNNRSGGNGGYRKGGRPNSGGYQKNRKPERTMEEILKEDRTDAEKKAKLYSKIEL